MTSVRIVGPGRAGRSLTRALEGRGWDFLPPLGRNDDISDAARGVDVLVVSTPDAVIAEVAEQIRPVDTTVVVHLAGALGLSVLAPHPRRAALHPLVSLPNPIVGAKRLVGAWYAIAGDPLCGSVVSALDGHSFTVADDQRAAYHAAASIAANHLVALMGQVKRIADQAGVPFAAYLDLARNALDNVAELGPEAALTGPVARGDDATVERHVRAIPASERDAYNAMADRARVLAGRGSRAKRSRWRRSRG